MLHPYLRLTPRGVSGLKSCKMLSRASYTASHPARGEWIEIRLIAEALYLTESHPARGEWIEIIFYSVERFPVGIVSPREG